MQVCAGRQEFLLGVGTPQTLSHSELSQTARDNISPMQWEPELALFGALTCLLSVASLPALLQTLGSTLL